MNIKNLEKKELVKEIIDEIEFWDLEEFEKEIIAEIEKNNISIDDLEKLSIVDGKTMKAYDNSDAFKKITEKENKGLFLRLKSALNIMKGDK